MVSTYWGSSKIVGPPTDTFWVVRLTDKKDQVARLDSMNWFLRFGATGFEPAT